MFEQCKITLYNQNTTIFNFHILLEIQLPGTPGRPENPGSPCSPGILQGSGVPVDIHFIVKII